MRSVKILHRMLLFGAGCLLVGLLLIGTASASEQGDQSGQEGQGVIVVCRGAVANRPMSLSGEPRKRSWRCVRANQPSDPDDEPIVIEIKEPRPINLGYPCIRGGGPAMGKVRSDMEITPPVSCLGKKG